MKLLLCAGLLAMTALADENLPNSLLTDRGRLLMSESFAQPVATLQAGRAYKTKKGWRNMSGQWEFAEGAPKGTQLKEDGRSAFVVCHLPFKEGLIQFDVRLDGCRQVIFRIQDAIPEHICSVNIRGDGFTAQKDDHDHAGPDKAVPFGKITTPVKAGEWKTVLVEIKGETMVTTMDGKSISGTHPLIAADKATIELVVTGESASFRNVRVWEALSKAR
jgi:hypothetical protein